MIRFAVLAALMVAACAPTSTPVEAPPPPPPLVTAPVPEPIAAPDTCGANALQHLIGKPRSEIPVPTDPSKRRVYCSTCPVTMDYSEERLNIVYDSGSGLITQVKCG